MVPRMCKSTPISWMALLTVAGCINPALLTQSEGPPPTQQVPASPFAEPRPSAPTRVSYAPASQETAFRVVLLKDKLVGQNPQTGLKPLAIAIGSADPEIFHVQNTIYITEGLVRQCPTDNHLAAALAFEMGRMVAEREATVSDEIRQPDRPQPIRLSIGGNGYASEADLLHHVEMVRYEKANPKHAGKLPRPDPQNVARNILERAGYQRTDLDAVLPALSNAERFSTFERQFKGPTKQSDWKAP